jgi:hypothetical protein
LRPGPSFGAPLTATGGQMVAQEPAQADFFAVSALEAYSV